MDVSDKLACFGVGASSLLVSVFYKMYCNRIKDAEIIKNSKTFQLKELNDTLTKSLGQSLDLGYATVEGIVQPYSQTLQSEHGTMKGVVKLVEKVEHKSRRVQGYWSDVKTILQDNSDSVPFKLTDPLMKYSIHVIEPQYASCLNEELTVTYDHFEPDQSSFLQTGIDRLFGEVSKGFQNTEKMLLVGTHLCGIGDVCIEHGKVLLNPPQNGSRYVLTKLSKGAIIRKIENQAFMHKFMSVLFGTASVGLLMYLLYRAIRWLKDYRKNQQLYFEIRAVNEHSDRGEPTDNECVVCLCNRRNVVLMNCRHICICSSCAELLPFPKMCPVCRQRVDNFLPLYNS